MEWETKKEKSKQNDRQQTPHTIGNRLSMEADGNQTHAGRVLRDMCVRALKSHLASDSDIHTPWGFKCHAHTERERQTQFLQWSSAVQGSRLAYRNKEVSEIEKDSASVYCKSKYPCVTVFMAGDSKPAPAVDICGSNVID